MSSFPKIFPEIDIFEDVESISIVGSEDEVGMGVLIGMSINLLIIPPLVESADLILLLEKYFWYMGNRHRKLICLQLNVIHLANILLFLWVEEFIHHFFNI